MRYWECLSCNQMGNIGYTDQFAMQVATTTIDQHENQRCPFCGRNSVREFATLNESIVMFVTQELNDLLLGGNSHDAPHA